MNKALKVIGALILIGAVLFFVLGFFGPKEFKMERSTTIHASRSVIFSNISDYRNWNKWSPWAKIDPNCKYEYYGPQGQADAGYKWSGNDSVGQGEMHTMELAQDMNMRIHLTFLKPWKSESDVTFVLDSAANGDTKVTWTFAQQYGFAQRPMMMFMNMEKMLGPDYEKGLANLKALCESAGATAAAPDMKINEIKWEKKSYITLRLKTTTDSLGPLFPVLMGKLMAYTKANKLETAEPVTGLYFTWDAVKKTTDMAVALPLKKDAKASGGFEVVTVDASNALEADFYGPYDNLGMAHGAIHKYIDDKKLKKKAPAIEEYITDPGVEKDSKKWLTKVYYLVD